MEKSINELNIESKLRRIRVVTDIMKESVEENTVLSQKYKEADMLSLSSYFEGRANGYKFIADWLLEILGEDGK